MSFTHERDRALHDDDALPVELREAFSAYRTLGPNVTARAGLQARVAHRLRARSYWRAATWSLATLSIGAALWWSHERIQTAPSVARLPEPRVVITAAAEPLPALSTHGAEEATVPAEGLVHPLEPSEPVRPAKQPPRRKGSVIASGDRAAELSLLLEARRRLATDPNLSLARIREHEQRHAHGRFVEEREVLAVEALLRASRPVEARARGAAFRSRFPNSPHLDRLGVLLSQP